MRRVWPFSFYFFSFASVACVVPFVVLYYQELSYTGTQIGFLTGITPIIALFSAPFWTRLADKTRRHHLIMNLTILIGSLALIVFPLFRSFWAILFVVIMLNGFLAPSQPFADSATMYMLGDKKEFYGRIRLGGTIGYGLIAPIVGVLVTRYGLKIAFWGSAVFMLLALIVSQNFVYDRLPWEKSVEDTGRSLLVRPQWKLFLTVAFAGGLSLAPLGTYLFPYMKELGADESTMGIALTIGTLVEIPVLFFGNRLIKSFKSYGLLMFTMIITAIRFLLFVVAGTTGVVLLIQLLNGLTFSAMWMAGVSYADENAPVGMSATAQGQFSAVVMGFGNAVGGFFGGLLLDRLGGRGLYLVFGSIILIIVAIVAFLFQRLPREKTSRGTA